MIILLTMNLKKAGTRKHYEKTIKNGISRGEVLDHSSTLLPVNDESLYIWGLSNGKQNKSLFGRMSVGDELLFVNYDKFYKSRIIGMTIDQTLGDYLWGPEDEKHWSNILFIENLQEVNLEREDLINLLNYKENYRFQRTLILEGEKEGRLDELLFENNIRHLRH